MNIPEIKLRGIKSALKEEINKILWDIKQATDKATHIVEATNKNADWEIFLGESSSLESIEQKLIELKILRMAYKDLE